MAVAQTSTSTRDVPPRADPRDGPRGPYTAARALPVAFLLTLLVARSFDATTHADHLYVPFVIALYVLPLWYVSGFRRGPWRTAPWALLAGQAVLTYLPFVPLGDGWAGGASGMLVGLVLLVAPVRRVWPLALSLLAVEGLLRYVVVGPPYLPTVNGATWAVIAATNGALAVFGLVRLAETVGELDATQDELARAAVLRERLAVGERLVGAVEDRVQLVARHARAALRWLSTTPEDARGEIAAAGRIAREAVTEGRRVHTDDQDAPGLVTGRATTPGLARAVLATGLALHGVQNLLDVAAPTLARREYDRPVAIVVAVLVSVAVAVLHWRHSGTLRGGARPPHWPVTLAVQTVLSYAQFTLIGTAGLIFLSFLAASFLLLVRGPWRWAWFAAVVLSLPALAWWADDAVMRTTPLLEWTGYATVGIANYGLMAYGLSRLAGLADRLAARREQLAELAAVDERLRLARDTHDLLGLGMSTLALKTDLVAALIGRDDRRAARELSELVSLCTTVRADAGRIAGERPALSLDSEFATATEVLAASGIEVFTEHEPLRLPPEVDTVFAIVLREAVTNILRHSSATRCAITLAADDEGDNKGNNDGHDDEGAGTVRFRISNDGATPPADDTRGRGLDNTRARVEALGGRLVTRHSRGTFIVSAEITRGRG